MRLVAVKEWDVVLLEVGGDEEEDGGEGDGPEEELDGECAEECAREHRVRLRRWGGEGEEKSRGEAEGGGEGERFECAGEAGLPVRAGEQEQGAGEEVEERGDAEEEAEALGEFAEQGGHDCDRSGWDRRGGDVYRGSCSWRERHGKLRWARKL